MKKPRPVIEQENGFASLVVAFIFIIVMALVTVGFSQVARREQRIALNNQLTTQAYYAAESGVNDIRNNLPAIIAEAGKNAATNQYFNGQQCLNNGPYSNLIPSGSLNSADGVSYSCATVNLTPPNEIISSANSTGAANFLFSVQSSSAGGAPSLKNLYFYWGSNATTTQPNQENTPVPSSQYCGGSQGSCFPSLSTWENKHYAPVVQLSLTPIYDGQVTRNNLTNDTFTVMLYPTANSAVNDPGNPNPATTYSCASLFPLPGATWGNGWGAVNYQSEDANTTNAGYPSTNPCNDIIVGAAYTKGAAGTPQGEYPFSVKITNIPPTPPNIGTPSQWLVHYNWAYGAINACLAANSGDGCMSSSSATTDFYGSQVEIDVTGKDKDVVKRIDEMVPFTTTNSGTATTQNGVQTLPSYAIQSNGTCKEFWTNPATPGANNTPANTSFSPLNNSCNLEN